MELKKLDYDITVCKVNSEKEIDLNKDFYFIGKTDEELLFKAKEKPQKRFLSYNHINWFLLVLANYYL